MQYSLILSASTLLSTTLALPHQPTSSSLLSFARRQDCDAFPWFISPKTGGDCSAAPIDNQPNSGWASNPASASCQLLSPDGATFQAVEATIACGGWTVTLYTADDPQCQGPGESSTAQDQCFTAGNYLSFSAQPVGDSQPPPPPPPSDGGDGGDQGDGSQDQGDGSQDQGDGSQDQGDGSQDQGDGSQDQGDGSQDGGNGSGDGSKKR